MPAKKHNKPKYLNHHLSYRQRLRLLTGTKYMTAKQAKILYSVGTYLIKHNHLPAIQSKPKVIYKRPKIIKRGHIFKKTVNQKQLSRAVHAMYLKKTGKIKIKVDSICHKFGISKPSLYRGFKAKYKNTK